MPPSQEKQTRDGWPEEIHVSRYAGLMTFVSSPEEARDNAAECCTYVPASTLHREIEARREVEKRKAHAEEWYAVRIERLRDLARDRSKAAPEGSELAQVWPDIASVLANGTLGPPDHPYEPPTYAQQLNIARHRAVAAEQKATELQGRLEPIAGRLERIRDIDEQTSDGALGSLARYALDELAAALSEQPPEDRGEAE